jgi:hypothetical protein
MSVNLDSVPCSFSLTRFQDSVSDSGMVRLCSAWDSSSRAASGVVWCCNLPSRSEIIAGLASPQSRFVLACKKQSMISSPF